MTGDQLGLLLWKNYVVRKRKPVVLGLTFIWPVVVFMIIYAVRDNVDPEYHPTCHFPARLMPHDGLLPFVQSFICSLDNSCEPLSEYELVPSYKNATLGPLILGIQPLLENDTLLSAVASMPKGIRLLQSMAETLTKPEIKQLFDRGIRLGDLFNNHELIKRSLMDQLPEVDDHFIDSAFNASIKLIYLIQTFGSSNIDGIICSPENLKKYLVVKRDEDLKRISEMLCKIDSSKVPGILAQMISHFDVVEIFELMNRVMAKFNEYDFFNDVRNTLVQILNLNITYTYVPSYLKIQQSLPRLIPLFRGVTFKNIDLHLIKKMIDELQPIFSQHKGWIAAERGLLRLNSLLSSVKQLIEYKKVNDSYNLENKIMDESITQILDATYMILQDGAIITNLLLDQHKNEIQLAAEILDGLRHFFSGKIMNTLSYTLSLIQNVVRMTHHVAVIHDSLSGRMLRVAHKHEELVQRLLAEIDSSAYRIIIRTFSRLEMIERLIAKLKKQKAGTVICQDDVLNEIFDDFKEIKSQSENINRLLCSKAGQEYITEMYDSLELENFGRIIDDVLRTWIQMYLHQPVDLEKSNFTSVVQNVNDLMTYLKSPQLDNSETNFSLPVNWKNAFTDTQAKGRIAILGIHLSMAKAIGSKSYSIITIKPSLQTMDLVADVILADLQSAPSQWIAETRKHQFELIESFYLTVSSPQKVLDIMDCNNFTETYCLTASAPPEFVNYPNNANKTLLKSIVCRLSQAVQSDLQLNVSTLKHQDDRSKFNWTLFNAKVVKLYEHIDSLVQDRNNYVNDTKLKALKDDFIQAWTVDVSLRQAFQTGVGVMCKFFAIIESPLFNVGMSPSWRKIYTMPWALSMILNGIEKITDQIQTRNNSISLNQVLQKMPLTENLIRIVLKNIVPVILDTIDMFILKAPVNFVTAISEYQQQVNDWPCLKNSLSIGVALGLRNGSREVIREIEKIGCSPLDFIREWLEQPLLSKTSDILFGNANEQLPVFNWTQGYRHFRRVTDKLYRLTTSSYEIFLKKHPSLAKYDKVLFPEVEQLIGDKFAGVLKNASNLVDFIDMEIDKVIRDSLPGNLSAKSVWQSGNRNAYYYVTLVKYLSVVVDDAAELVLRIWTKDSQNLEMLPLLGFENKSVVSIVYHQLPYILTTLINAMSDAQVDSRISTWWQDGKMVSCSTVFSWFFDYRMSLNIDEYMTIQNFTCNGDLKGFNSYIDWFVDSTMLWRKPISKYQARFLTMSGSLQKLATTINNLIQTNFNVTMLFTANYFNRFIKLLNKSLSITNVPVLTQQNARVNAFRLSVEGVSEGLTNIAQALRETQMKDQRLYMWDLFKHQDVKKLLRTLENEPVKSIALFATMSLIRLNATISIRSLRQTICEQNFDSEYWSRPDSKQFLQQICTFDPYDLLAAVTSEEYKNTILHGKHVFNKQIPLASSVAMLVDQIVEFMDKWPNAALTSNIVNATTYLNLPNDTHAMLNKVGESWVHELILVLESKNVSQMFNDDVHQMSTCFAQIGRMVQLVTSVAELSSGGDLWLKFRQIYDKSKIKPVLIFVEDLPNLGVTALHTFINSERLLDFFELYLEGRVNTCDIDKYLILPSYIRKGNLMSSIANLCHQLIRSNDLLTVNDFLPFYYPVEKNEYSPNSIKTFLLENVRRAQIALIRAILDDGPKKLKLPFWWTSFEEETYRDFKNIYRKKDLRATASLVSKKLLKFFKQSVFLHHIKDNNSCDWCNTFLLDIINSQLDRHSQYADFLCEMYYLRTREIEQIMLNEFYWNETLNMIKAYTISNNDKKNLNDFMSSLKVTVQHLTDIAVDFQNETYKKNVNKCFYQFIGGPSLNRPGLYASIISGFLEFIEKNIQIVDSTSSHRKLINLTRLMERHIAIWKPLKLVTKESDSTSISQFLPNALINVNLIVEKHTSDKSNMSFIYRILSSKKSRHLLQYDAETARYPTIREISARIEQSLDFDLINREIRRWRRDAANDLTWLKKTVKNVAFVVEESASLLDVASKIDFENVTNVLEVPDLIDGVLNILRDKTIEKLFDGLRELLDDAEPLITDKNAFQDLHTMVNITQSMDILKNVGLLDLTFTVRDIFGDWDIFSKYLIEEANLENDVVLTLSKAKVDMLSIFVKERNAISLKETVCSPEKLETVLQFDSSQISGDQVSDVLCQLDNEHTLNIAVVLIKNLNFEYIMENLMSANVKGILRNANLTEDETKEVVQHLGVAPELVGIFKDKLPRSLIQNVTQQSDKDAASSMQFLSDTSKMLCGKQLMTADNDFYRTLSSIDDSKQNYDKDELNSMPTDFCKNTYKDMMAMKGGKIVWSYIKPLLRGRIIYTPKTPLTAEIMSTANKTFLEMEKFVQLVADLRDILISLSSLTEMTDKLNDLKGIMSTEVMKVAIKSMTGADFEGDLSSFDFGDLTGQSKMLPKIISMFGTLHSLLGCVLIDRVQGFASEEELEQTSHDLMQTNDLLAAVVFFDQGQNRRKRASNQTLPDELRYEIRMDIDYVQSTTRLKKQFWIPGPEADFIEDLRYLRGFVQLQDSIDKSIIHLKAPKLQKWTTLVQQMPYPCYKQSSFQSTLYESQGVPVSFFFALMMVAGSAVRYIVWERESQNSMVMSVMGLKPWRNTLAWFITSYIEFAIVMLTILVILVGGSILPKSDPALLLLMMLDYAFSAVAFCYMISTMFSSASLAAVTTVVMFLLTYMPYIIVIAMEANVNLGYKLLMCLSMSTSFCYGLLFAGRKEVQGIGLRWFDMWDESSPGDLMSLGLVLIMLFIDGCIYTLVGYVITRYTNSEVESNATSLAISEKHVGVHFENVRKVYRTNEGRDCVAVDDFNLKLCEGEVTSLLGRNGAGKTTIIKMLTGMIRPTNGEIIINGDESDKPDIGVCPQDNVLIDTLTPREHMIFYAKLKKPNDESKMMSNIDQMMCSLELGYQENEPVSRLSGGTRRRLCVGLAFLGQPKLVILDEPGAGVDPAARRRIWRLIDEFKLGRTVVLSTHHLDEADMLSDTVVIMHKGKILRHGSPLFLKTTCGRGYRMYVSYPETVFDTPGQKRNLQTLRALVESVVSNAQLQETSASEVLIVLPFQSKHGVNNDIAGVAKILEDNQKLLAFTHFSLECDNLERVFLDLCSKEDTEKPVHDINGSHQNDVDLIGYEPAPNPTPMKQMAALLTKKLWHFARDWRAPLAALFLPTLFIAVAMGFSLIRPPSGDEPPLILTPNLYNTQSTYFYSIENTSDQFFQRILRQLRKSFGDDTAPVRSIMPNETGTCDCLDGHQVCNDQRQIVEGLVQVPAGRSTLDWIISTQQVYIEKRYGGWSLFQQKEEPLFVVWYNNKGHHALPAYLNALNEAILRSSGVPGRLAAVNHPLKLSSDQLNRTTLLQHVADVGVALVLLIAFNLVGAQGAKELVRERLSEEKRILYLSGVRPVVYWTTAFLWDFAVFACSIVLAVIVFEIFGLPAYVARDNLAGVSLLLTLFAWAIIPIIHLSEKCFDDASLSTMVLFCANTFVGVVSLASILVIDILGKTQTARHVRNILHHVLLLFPQYALGDALVEITKNDIAAQLLGRFDMDVYVSPLSWNLLGLHFILLFVIGAVSYLANLIIECRALPCMIKRRNKKEPPKHEDEDVSKERSRVESCSNRDVVRVINLRKEYHGVSGTNVAVQNLTFGVQAATCFGLLGVNGAGKSTTFKMLTTETLPTDGRLFFRDTSIGRGPLCNGDVGYCPQWDALDGFLTPHQTLTVHGQVCGLLDVSRAVERMLKRFDLVKYAHRRIDSLSGGNKRKLCAAISVMAPTALVLMDEPTSGMDPASKELVSKAILHVTRYQGCVILTSHSVADCEKICTKVGVLDKGAFRCFGTPSHLKHRFSKGHVAFLRLNEAITRADLRQAISKHLPYAVISSSQAAAARLWLPRTEDTCLSATFIKLRQLAEELKITDYTLTQSSLDQVLVNFSNESEDSLDSQLAQDNLAFSRDSIHMDSL